MYVGSAAATFKFSPTSANPVLRIKRATEWINGSMSWQSSCAECQDQIKTLRRQLGDPDRLGLADAREDREGRLIAPPSRVMLDLYLESRGDAAAGVFLDLWGSKVL